MVCVIVRNRVIEFTSLTSYYPLVKNTRVVENTTLKVHSAYSALKKVVSCEHPIGVDRPQMFTFNWLSCCWTLHPTPADPSRRRSGKQPRPAPLSPSPHRPLFAYWPYLKDSKSCIRRSLAVAGLTVTNDAAEQLQKFHTFFGENY